MKNMRIYSLNDILDDLEKNITNFPIVSIRDPDVHNSNVYKNPLYEAIDRLAEIRKREIVIEYFLDATPAQIPEELYKFLPTEEHVKEILVWCKDKNSIVVHCTAGISRSAAMAYLIACIDSDPVEALNILSYIQHCPNKYIISLGAKILDNPKILAEYETWNKKHEDKYKSGTSIIIF